MSPIGLCANVRKALRAKIQQPQNVTSFGKWRKPKKRQASVPVIAKVISCASGTVKIKKISPVRSQLAGMYSTNTRINIISSSKPWARPSKIMPTQLRMTLNLLIKGPVRYCRFRRSIDYSLWL